MLNISKIITRMTQQKHTNSIKQTLNTHLGLGTKPTIQTWWPPKINVSQPESDKMWNTSPKNERKDVWVEQMEKQADGSKL